MSYARIRPLILLVGLMLFTFTTANAEPSGAQFTDEGLHTESWFNTTTGDLSKDLQAATAQGKMLAIFWEQEGCSYCKKMHEVNLKVEDTVALIRDNFYVVLLNTRGTHQIKDFDGAVMSQADLSHRHQVNGTPNVEFRNGEGEEVYRMPGYAEPPLFRGVFEYVISGGYHDTDLIAWYRAKYLN